MAEPTSTTAAAAIGGGAIALAGIVAGLPPDLLLPAFVGSLWGLRYLDPGRMRDRVAQVIVSTLLALWSATALSHLGTLLVPGAAGLDAALLRPLLAFLVGWGGLGLGLPWIAGKLTRREDAQ